MELPWAISEARGVTHAPTLSTYLFSDGSNKIYEMSLENKPKIMKTFRISDSRGRELKNIGELEFINGLVWATIDNSNEVAVIDLSKKSAKMIDFSKLKKIAEKVSKSKGKELTGEDNLSGIAYDPDRKRVILTGKNWPLVFEIGSDLKMVYL